MYKPKIWIILVDILIIAINVVFVFVFLPLTTPTPFQKYDTPLLVFTFTWILLSYLFKRYERASKLSFFKSLARLFYVSLITFIFFGGFILIQPKSPYSENVLTTIMVGIFLLEYLFLFFYHAYKYATQYELPLVSQRVREADKGLEKEYKLSEDAVFEREKRIKDMSGERVYNFLSKNTDLNLSNTFLISDVSLNELSGIKTFQYSTFIILKRLNFLRGINKTFSLINEKLPDNGLLVCCYKSQSTIKQNIFKKYPRVIADIYYFAHFILHRLLPKLLFTSRLYFDLTEGQRRILSKTEVLGRLNYCGFKIERVAKVNDDHYVFARRVENSQPALQRPYGILIKLKRRGKGGKLFNVYKFRTMHPYAEFLQDYVYRQSSLDEGGKFRRDIRVTTIGRVMHKFWIDELPMLYNLLKGDMKLVGVRPLSEHYFSLYTKELQELRIKHRPGLLPPFYADMPKTLDEIEASEMKYLQLCEKNGTFVTDVKYFFLILKNIIFKKARSA